MRLWVCALLVGVSFSAAEAASLRGVMDDRASMNQPHFIPLPRVISPPNGHWMPPRPPLTPPPSQDLLTKPNLGPQPFPIMNPNPLGTAPLCGFNCYRLPIERLSR